VEDQLQFAIITAALTVAGGVLVVSITEILKTLYLRPIGKINEHIGTIIDRLIFYSANLTNYNSDRDEIIAMRSHLRSASSQLRAKKQSLKLYGFWAFLGLVPKSKSIDLVCRELIGLSNGIPVEGEHRIQDSISNNHDALVKIESALRFKLN